MEASILISISRQNGHVTKIWKTTFPKEFFQWNVAQSRRTWIDLHYWNKILQKIWLPKKFLSHPQNMLICADYLKTAQPISFFKQMMRIWYLGKRGWKKSWKIQIIVTQVLPSYRLIFKILVKYYFNWQSVRVQPCTPLEVKLYGNNVYCNTMEAWLGVVKLNWALPTSPAMR